jgi:DNA-binding NarL/FixJ family response regulator
MEQPLPIKVVLADRHNGMLFTARLLLEAESDLEVVGSAGDLGWARRLASEAEADVLVVDLHMLGGAARAAVTELRRTLPHTAVVILTMEATPALVPALFNAGASGYVLKEFAEVDLADAVRDAASGHSFISAKLSTV